MIENVRNLNDVMPGQSARIKKLNSSGSIRRRLLDIGLVENTEVECLGRKSFRRSLCLPYKRSRYCFAFRGLQ